MQYTEILNMRGSRWWGWGGGGGGGGGEFET